jgi:ribosomal protein L7/L12
MLIQCPECKREVSDKAVSCPHCGYPLSEQKPRLYSVVLTDCGMNKIKVVRTLRGITRMNLSDAMNFVSSLPRAVSRWLDENTAVALKSSFEASGASVELRLEEDDSSAASEIRCPRCNSTQIQIMRKNDFSFGKAAMGTAMFGGVGSAAGLIGTGKTERVCVNCGHRF